MKLSFEHVIFVLSSRDIHISGRWVDDSHVSVLFTRQEDWSSVVTVIGQLRHWLAANVSENVPSGQISQLRFMKYSPGLHEWHSVKIFWDFPVGHDVHSVFSSAVLINGHWIHWIIIIGGQVQASQKVLRITCKTIFAVRQDASVRDENRRALYAFTVTIYNSNLWHFVRSTILRTKLTFYLWFTDTFLSVCNYWPISYEWINIDILNIRRFTHNSCVERLVLSLYRHSESETGQYYRHKIVSFLLFVGLFRFNILVRICLPT